MKLRILIIILMFWGLTLSAEPARWEAATVGVREGFAAPESVVYDPATGAAYVANMNATPEQYWQDTGNGFISRLHPDGTVDTHAWVKSTTENVLNQPKGMAILDGKLYVADNTRMVVIGMADAEIESVMSIEGAEKLNDVAAHGGQIYVSDTVTGRILRLAPSGDDHESVAQLEGVNGIAFHEDTLYAVSWSQHDLYEISLDGTRPPAAFGLAEHFENLDGIAAMPDGAFIVSDHTGNAVYAVEPDRRTVHKLHDVPTAADMGWNAAQNRLYVPQLGAGRVTVLDLRRTTEEPLALDEARDREFAELRRQILDRRNWDNERLANEAHRPEALVLETDRTPVDIVWRRTHALLDHLQSLENAPDLTREAAALDALAPRVAALEEETDGREFGRFRRALSALRRGADEPGPGDEVTRALFHEVCTIRRAIAFANPLLDFDRILFLKRHKSIYEHMCDQYYGIAARPGGGLYVLEDAFTDAPRARNLLEGAVVERGRLRGEQLRGGVSPEELHYDGEGLLTESSNPGGGAFLSPDLSFDATEVLFSYVECRGDKRHAFRRENPGEYWKEPWDPGRAYHVFRVNIDGTGLEQLTDGPWNDIHPIWMPDGRVVFVSERRGGFLRCGRVCPTYTMYQMNADGGFIRPFSYHETHEWLPSVDHNGMVVYTRWDYVDRDSDIAHHLWLTYPDGRDPRGPHGNYPLVREHRPWIEQSFRAIPGSHKYLATAARHHGQHFGSLITVDLRIADNATTSQLKRVTPETMFPESEAAPGVPFEPRGGAGNGQVYGTPWPLSEDFYLAVYDPGTTHHDLYLVDGFGNRELVYHDPEIACSDPVPLKPRPTPPVIPAQTRYAENPGEQPETGTIAVMNVYDSMRPWPEGTRLKELRLIQLFPKSTPKPGAPNIGAGDESVARGALGTVPIEEDGSVYLEAPAGITFYFQALDEKGMAVQTMRSATYLHPGEHLSCAGCHEPKQAASPAPARTPLAMQKPPAQLRPEPEGSFPLQFARLVQPVLDAHCVACHETEEGAPGLAGDVLGEHGWSEAFHALVPFAWTKHGGNYAGITRNKTSYSIPGEVGARASKLLPLLEEGHYGVELTAEERRRITLWLDANSVFYGAYHDLVTQARGETVMPHLQ